MAVTVKNVFIASETIDDRGREGKVVGIYETETEAKVSAQKRGWYGSDGSVRPARVLVLEDGRVYLLSDRVDGAVEMGVDLIAYAEEVKARAKRKLLDTMSQEELNILGIKL